MSELSARARLVSEAQPLPRMAAQLYWLSIPPKSRSGKLSVSGRADRPERLVTSQSAVISKVDLIGTIRDCGKSFLFFSGGQEGQEFETPKWYSSSID